MGRPRKETTVADETLNLQHETMKGSTNKKVTLKIKATKRPPTKGTEKASCYDVYLPSAVRLLPFTFGVQRIPLGLSMEIPKGYDVRLYLRSSVARDLGLIMTNSVAIIDEDFRGEIVAYVLNTSREVILCKEGERLFQFELHKKEKYDVEFVSEIDTTGTGRGLASGSTGK